MRAMCILAISWLTLGMLPIESASAEPRYSGSVHAGYVLAQDIGLGAGGWASVARDIGAHWSVGAEAGYAALPTADAPFASVARGAPLRTGGGSALASASGALMFRNAPPPAHVYVIGTVGYYDLAIRSGFGFPRVPGKLEHERHAGFSIGAGISGSGQLAPGFELRWHHVSDVDRRDIMSDALSFEFGLHFE